MTSLKPMTPCMHKRLKVFLVSVFLLVSFLVGLFYLMDQGKDSLKKQLTHLSHLGHEITYKTLSTSLEFHYFFPSIRLHFDDVVWKKNPHFRVDFPTLDVTFSLLRPTHTHLQFAQATITIPSSPYKLLASECGVTFNNTLPILSAAFNQLNVFLESDLVVSLQNISCDTRDAVFSYVYTSPQGTEKTCSNPAIAIDLTSQSLTTPILGPLTNTMPFTEISLKLMIIDPGYLTDVIKSPNESLVNWRNANGFVEISRYSLKWGEAQASGDGTLALDDLLRIEAAGSISITHISEILKRIAQTQRLTAKETILLNLSLGMMNSQNHVSLPLTLQGGVLSIGNFLKLDAPLDFSFK